MSGLRAYVEQCERKMRGPVSIAFDLVRRGVFVDLDNAYNRVCELLPRPNISDLLRTGKRASSS